MCVDGRYKSRWPSPRTNNEVDNTGNTKQVKTGFIEPIRSEKLKTEVAVWYS